MPMTQAERLSLNQGARPSGPSAELVATHAQLQRLRVAIGNWRHAHPAMDLAWADLLARVGKCIEATGVTP